MTGWRFSGGQSVVVLRGLDPRIQIYVALIAFLLLRILHQTAARSLKDSAALLLTRLKLGLFGPFSLREHATPPPKPPALRPPNRQTCFAFQ